MAQPKTFFIRTYGCQMNENDTEVMAGVLRRRGLERTLDEHNADLLIFNTCSVRDLAERKAMGKIGLLADAKKQDAIIGVTGCMANAKKDSLFHKLPHVNFVLGTNNIHELDAVLDEVLASGKPTIRTDERFSHELDYASAMRQDKLRALVSIIRGCDKFCTYCVVPYTRGPEVSRSPEAIIEECRQLIDQGYKEFTLLGQNVNSFGKDQPEWSCLFHDLLYRLDALPGMGRIRFMTSHPVDITRDLMEAISALPSVCEFVHFPMQAGSNRILKKMHRIYTVEQYLEKVQALKEIVKDVVLGTDIIVGFPTETDEDFEETCRLMREIRFTHSFIFTYSPRKGTPAMRWKDDIPQHIKEERQQRLMSLQEEIHLELLQGFLGREVEVLVEAVTERDAQMVKGRTRCWNHVVFAGGQELVGTFQRVKIHGYTNKTLLGSSASSSL